MAINSSVLLFALRKLLDIDILVWMVGIALVIAAIVVMVIQLKSYRRLKKDLELVGRMKTHSVEFDMVLKAMKLAIWRVNTTTRVLNFESDYRDQADCLIFPPGATVDDMYAMLDERDSDTMRKHFEKLMEGLTDDFRLQYRMRMPHSDRTYWSEVFATVDQRDLHGKPLSVVCASMRIDQQKEIEDALMDAVYHAEESDRLKSAFLANISHEIRTPLNAIVGFSEILVTVDDAEEHKKLIGLIKQNNAHLLHLFDDIVNMSKLEAKGGSELRMSTFSVDKLFEELADKYIALVQEKGLELTVTSVDKLPDLTTDRDRLREILNQYLSNAVKFTTKGGVTLGATLLGDKIRIWVRDTGKGIPKEKCNDQLFERFVKVDEFMPGTGLGLSICRSMAMMINGEIGLESKLGVGSTFWIDLAC